MACNITLAGGEFTTLMGCLKRVHLKDPPSPASCFYLLAQDSRPIPVLVHDELRVLNRCLFAWDPVDLVFPYFSSLLSQDPARMLVLSCMLTQDLDKIGGLTCALYPLKALGHSWYWLTPVPRSLSSCPRNVTTVLKVREQVRELLLYAQATKP